MMSDQGTVVVLYIKENCGLCEDMHEQVEDYLKSYQAGQVRLEIRDIEDNAEWMAVYREYVPTLVVSDQEVCHYFFDPQEFTEALECPSHT